MRPLQSMSPMATHARQQRNLSGTGDRWVPGAASLLFVAFVLGCMLALIIPPLKSADELDHVKRAYFLSQGQVLLHTQSCTGESAVCRKGRSMSGGMIDVGLLDYLRLNDPTRRTTESALQDQYSDALGWQGRDVFEPAAGTGYYFPGIYLPQAVGLGVGKVLGLGIDHSYQLARLLAFAVGMLVYVAAFLIHRPPVVLLALLLLPMSIFQAMSASIDFLATALAVLALCCFLRISVLRDRSTPGLFWLMAVAIFVVATARAHLAPMVMLLFVAAFFMRARWSWLLAVITTGLILVWMAVVIPATVDFRIARDVTTGDVALHYLRHPHELLPVLLRTWTDPGLLKSYLASFIGIFLNLPLKASAYLGLSGLVLLIALLSLAPWNQWRSQGMSRCTLLICGLISAVLAFLAMLLTWTPHPATVVEGVQGRYLLVPVMMVLLACASWVAGGTVILRIRQAMLLVLAGAALLLSVQRMLTGYYRPLVPTVPVTVALAASPGSMQPGPLLAAGSDALELHVEDMRMVDEPVQWIGIMLATYRQELQGRLRLMLTTADGSAHAVDLTLDDPPDNDYVFVKVPPGRYVQASLAVVALNAGFSVWQYKPADSAQPAQNCVALVHARSGVQHVPGCPVPR